MERLHDVLTTGDYDLVVLDTPPTRSALDILDAPGRLVRFLDERVLEAFLGAGAEGSARAWIRAKGAEVAMRMFGAMAGDALMEELAAFFEVFFHLRKGFAQRAARVLRTLESPTTAFVLVTAPDVTHLSDAAYLRDGLISRGTPIEGVVFNRAFHAGADGSPLDRDASWPDDAIEGPEGVDVVRDAARAMRSRLVAENRAFSDAIEAFMGKLPDAAESLRLPALRSGPASLDALASLLDHGR